VGKGLVNAVKTGDIGMTDLIIVILVNIIAWTMVSSSTEGIHQFLLYALIVLCDVAYVVAKFKSH